MANFNEYTQSNNFKVENIEEFKKELSEIDGTSLFEFNNDGEVYVAAYEGLESYVESDNEEKEDICMEYDDYLHFIQKHMCEDQKVFINSVGHENLRYLAASCSIVTKDDIMHYDFFNMMEKDFNNNESVF